MPIRCASASAAEEKGMQQPEDVPLFGVHGEMPFGEIPCREIPFGEMPGILHRERQVIFSPIYGPMYLLTSQIWELIKERGVPEHNIIVFDDVTRKLTYLIYKKSRQSDANTFNIRVCENTDVKIETIVSYMVGAFDGRTSRFNRLLGNFCKFIGKCDEPTKTIAAIIEQISICEDRIACISRLLNHVASFDENACCVGCTGFSRNIVIKHLKELRENFRKMLYCDKCTLALIGIATSTDGDLICATLSQRCDRVVSVCEKVRTIVETLLGLDFDIRKDHVVNDRHQQFLILEHIMQFCDWCIEHCAAYDRCTKSTASYINSLFNHV